MTRISVEDRSRTLPESVDDHPLVVGVDGSPQSRAALDWAVAEARALGRPLHLLHAHSVGVTWPEVDVTGVVEPEHDAIVTEALERVVARPDAPTVTTRSRGGNAATLLVEASRDATAVVVGAPRHGGLGRAVVGSTSVEVAARAGCEVVVVRDGVSPAHEGRSVVVGSDGSDASSAAIGTAFRRAARLGLPLTVVHAWWVTYAGPTLVIADVEADRRRLGEEARAMTERVVAAWSAEYPGVDVRQQVVHGDPVTVLADLSDGAEVVVVGSHGRSEIGGLLLGSVSQGLLRRAACPVVVVRPDPRSTDGGRR